MLTYALNHATEPVILQHLQACNTQFSPRLSTRVNLNEFAHKIRQYAATFEAWHNDALAGLVACYYNDPNKALGFITHVSVLSPYSKQGIATTLLQHCVTYGEQQQFATLELQVQANNQLAIHLYQHFGFYATTTQQGLMVMKKNIQKAVN